MPFFASGITEKEVKFVMFSPLLFICIIPLMSVAAFIGLLLVSMGGSGSSITGTIMGMITWLLFFTPLIFLLCLMAYEIKILKEIFSKGIQWEIRRTRLIMSSILGALTLLFGLGLILPKLFLL